MNPFVNQFGQWVYNGDPLTGLHALSKSNLVVPVLDLSNVPLSHLPKCLANIDGLEELYLDNNNLCTLPTNIGQISKLRKLSLGHNQIQTLPTSIHERWATLEILFLGDNQFSAPPFDEDWMTMFKQGSIGNNPIPEPISPFWMLKQDAQEFPERIEMLFLQATTSQNIIDTFIHQATTLILGCPEPMIYEKMLHSVSVDTITMTIDWNDWLSQPKHQPLQQILLHSIPRGSLLHPSLTPFMLSEPS